MIRFRKTLTIALLVLGITAFVVHYICWYYLLKNSPTLPNPATGQLYVLNEHGYLFFVTRFQKALGYVCMFVYAFAGVAAVILNVRYKVFKNPLDDRPKRFY